MDFTWLQDAKKQSQKNQNRMSFRSPNVRFTGYGPDGVNQPNNPTNLINTTNGPRMLHEGEITVNNSDGSTRVYSQEELKGIEQHGVPGYKCGGKYVKGYRYGGEYKAVPGYQNGGSFTTPGRVSPIQPIKNPNIKLPDNRTPFEIPKKIGTPDIGQTKIPDVTTGPFVPGRKKMNIPTIKPQKDINVGGKIPFKIDPIVPDKDIDVSGKIPFQIQNIQPTDPIAQGIGFQEDPIQQTDTGPVIGQGDIGFQEDVSYPVEPTIPDQGQITDPNQYQEWFDQAIQHYQNILQNGNPAQRAEAQRYLDQLAARQATSQQALGQRLAQQGITGPESRTAQLMAGRQAGQEYAQAIGDVGVAALQARDNAANQMANLAMQGMGFQQGQEEFEWNKETWNKQFDFAMQKYGDQEGVRIAQDINSGMTFDQIRQKYPNVTLEDYESMKKFSTMGFAQQQWLEGNRQWQAQMDFAKEQYGDQQGGRLYDAIARGMTYSQIQDMFPDLNVTMEDYMSMREATPIGQSQYNRTMDAVNMLLQAGGEGNYKQAAQMLGNIFPDMDIDFENLISEDNAVEFNSGMEQMSRYIASGMDWWDAKKAMKKDGTFDKLGMNTEEVREMYEKMQLESNPVYQIMNSMPDEMIKEMFPDMEEKEARTMIGKLALFGGIKMNDDGSFDVDQELWNKLMNGEDVSGDDDDQQQSGGKTEYRKYAEKIREEGGTPISKEQYKKQKEEYGDIENGKYANYRISALQAGVKEDDIENEKAWKALGRPETHERENIVNDEVFKSWDDEKQFDYFMSNETENVPLNVDMTIQRWKQAGRPKTWSEYTTGADSIYKKHDSFIKDNKFLLDSTQLENLDLNNIKTSKVFGDDPLNIKTSKGGIDVLNLSENSNFDTIADGPDHAFKLRYQAAEKMNKFMSGKKIEIGNENYIFLGANVDWQTEIDVGIVQIEGRPPRLEYYVYDPVKNETKKYIELDNGTVAWETVEMPDKSKTSEALEFIMGNMKKQQEKTKEILG